MSGALARVLADALGSLECDVAGTDGDALSGAALKAQAELVANGLARMGAAPTEPVHVQIGNRPADLGSLLGIWRAGAVAVPVHVSAAPATVESLQRSTRARFLVDSSRVEQIASDAPPARPLLREAALVIFTSGSTGASKGVVISHDRLADKLAVLDRLLNVRANDVVLLPLQLTFIFGLWVSLLAASKGARLILMPKFSSDAAAPWWAQATAVAGVPSMFRALAAARLPAPRLRLLMSGGEILSPTLPLALRELTDGAIHDLYGLTETGSCDFHAGPAEQQHGFGTIGRPTEGIDFRIDPSGELQIRTPFGLLGYFDDERLTEDSFADGYFKTGDLARRTPQGLVAIIGRAKEIISRGGVKIAPLEIDNLLVQHPDVAAALCAGVPDERLGEVIHAVVVPRRGTDPDPRQLREWLLTRTERFKVPDVFYFQSSLPSGPTGKADRRAIAQIARASR